MDMSMSPKGSLDAAWALDARNIRGKSARAARRRRMTASSFVVELVRRHS
jgi:hypothetical protein